MIGNIFIVAALIFAASGAYYIGTKKLVGFAMDRKTPTIMKNGIDTSKLDEHLREVFAKMKTDEQRLLNSDTERVEAESRDGLRLVGHIRGCENPKRIIIAMHGWRSSWARDFGIISDFWHDNNCVVLYAEQRGQGESEGEYMSFGLEERYDCLTWINFINKMTGATLPIYLGGVSMGATTVLMTAGFDLPENIKGIVADCGFTTPDDIWKYVARRGFHLPYGKIQSFLADRISRKKSGNGTNEYSTIEAMEQCKIPVLFIHGADDSFVPVDMTYKNYKACRSEKRLLIVPGANHGMSYIENRDGYEEAIKEFWKDCD